MKKKQPRVYDPFEPPIIATFSDYDVDMFPMIDAINDPQSDYYYLRLTPESNLETYTQSRTLRLDNKNYIPISIISHVIRKRIGKDVCGLIKFQPVDMACVTISTTAPFYCVNCENVPHLIKTFVTDKELAKQILTEFGSSIPQEELSNKA